MDNFYIYKIINKLNNKIYIGKRKTKKQIELDDYYGSGIKITRSVEKYGKENFSKEILDICKNDNELNDKEIYWINYFKSTDLQIGYNISKGGNGGHNIYIKDSEKLENIKNKFKGSKNPMFNKTVYGVWLEKYGKEIADKKMIERGNKQKQYVVWNKGKKDIYSEEVINNLRDSRLRKDINKDMIKNLINEGKNVREVCKILKISSSFYYTFMKDERKCFMVDIDYDLMDSLLKEGKKIKEICDIMLVTRQTCYRHFNKTNQDYPKKNKIIYKKK